MAAGFQLVGHTLGHYHIIEQIGAGGMGVVYRARDEQLERDVAVKVLPPGTLIDEAAGKRFRNEALVLAKLNHPHVATVHEFGSQDGTDFIVTEYIPGLTFDTKLATGALAEKEVVTLSIQLAQGLSAAHEHGIVHRDLKPANLRLTSDGRLKILDFGLAQLMPHASKMGMTATLTRSQEVTGTLPYMAPEQLRGEPADVRTDIWAAGAVLYEMATGHRPFQEKVPTALAGEIIHKPPPPPRSLKSELSPKLEAVILKCLEKEPPKRYQSARELQTDLERLITGVTPIAARRQLWPIILTLGSVLVVLAVGAFSYTHRATALTEKDIILLADFDNRTGDAVFDDALKQALAVDLEQSPFLNILSDQKVANTLQLMGRQPSTKLTPDLSRDLCQRAASKAVLEGFITRLGNQYLIGLNAVNCINGDTLAREQVQAANKENILTALDKAASDLRRKLGESLGSIHKFDVPLEQATTSSLEALKAYGQGEKAWSESGHAAAIPFFKRAVDLDPNFAMADAALGTMYLDIGQPDPGMEYLRKAFELRDRVTEREKFYITTHYDDSGDLAVLQTYELWEHAYPQDPTPVVNMGDTLQVLGEYEKAVTMNQEALHLEPNEISAADLALSYLALNRSEDARRTLDQAVDRKLAGLTLHLVMYQLAFFKADNVEMERQVAWAGGKPENEGSLLSAQSDTEAYYARLVKAREFSRRAVGSAVRAGYKERGANWQANAALREAELGNVAASRQGAMAALALIAGQKSWVTSGYGRAVVALTLARIGDIQRAKVMVAELEKNRPRDTVLNRYWLPVINAATELNRGQATKTLSFLEATAPYELGQPWPLQVGTLYPAYMRGQAYLLGGDGNAAAAEFQKILDHRRIVLNFLTGALAHLQLGRSYAMSGNAAKARTAYNDFFTLWKDADPDIPILKEAKAEYAKLQ